MSAYLAKSDQPSAIAVLNYVIDLFTVANKETFTRTEILLALNLVKNDPEIFDAAIVSAWDDTVRIEDQS